jgi:hypothetical protein
LSHTSSRQDATPEELNVNRGNVSENVLPQWPLLAKHCVGQATAALNSEATMEFMPIKINWVGYDRELLDYWGFASC